MSTGVQAEIGRIVWHDLVAADVDQATAFYSTLLGWEVDVWRPAEGTYPLIRAGGQEHGGFVRLVGVPPHWHGSVLVADAAAATSLADELGGRIIRPATDLPGAGRFAVIGDPQGAVFAVFEALEPTTAPSGAFAWDELRATDLEEAKRFYGELFGWSSAEMDVGKRGTYSLFQHRQRNVAGLVSKPDEAPGAHWLTYLATDDVDAAVEWAGVLGATTIMAPNDALAVGRIAILKDPLGAIFGLLKAQRALSCTLARQ
jgi:predicted enzyme related to lactoylglutathione lyase